jgi:uncharacterized membrane protein
MKKLSGIFLTGLVAILPTAITLYLLYWIGSSAEALLGGLLERVLPAGIYVTGMGVISGILLIFLLGLLLNAYLIRRLWTLGEQLMTRIPLVKTIFGASQDLMGFFSPSGQKDLNQVVMVPVGDTGYRLMGFITRQDFSALPPGVADEDMVAVYAPFSYQIGGYTLMVPRSKLTPVDMKVEEAMRFALTAAVSTGRPTPSKAAAP